MTGTDPIREDELHAWIDGRIAPDRRAAVEAWLAAHPEQRSRLDAYRTQDAVLRGALDAAVSGPVPERLERAAHRPYPRYRLASLAAAALALIVGAGAGWGLRDALMDEPGNFALQAAVAHEVFVPEQRHPVEVAANEADHLTTWLGKRLGGPLAAPDLSSLGYRLVGGRLLATESGPAAQLMYEDADGGRLTLYLRTDVKDEPEHAWWFAKEGDIDVYYWVMDGRALAVVGAMSRAELEAAGDLASAW